MSTYSVVPPRSSVSSADVTALQAAVATEQAKPLSMLYGAVSSLGQTATPNGGAAADGRRIPVGYEVTTAGTAQLGIQFVRAVSLRNLRGLLNVPAGNGVATNVTVLVNGVATALTIAIPTNSGAGVEDNSNVVNVPAGALVELVLHHAADIGATLMQLFVTCEVHAQ